MNDDELIQRLRRTLRAEADAVTPMHGTPRVMPRRRPTRRRVLGGPGRAVVAMVAAAAIGGIAAVAVDLHDDAGRTRISVTAPNPHGGASNNKLRPVAPVTTTSPTASPTTAVPPVTTVPPVTVPAAGTGMASDFVPLSVTFVSPAQGWVLGTEMCGGALCLRLGETYDHGASWTDGPTPGVDAAALLAASTGHLQVRFADPSDGWIYDTAPGAGLLWYTTDGGATWSPETLPGGTDTTIDSLEAADRQVTAAVVANDGVVYVDDAPVTTSRFVLATTVTGGAAGATQATVVLQAATGWVVVDRGATTVGGASRHGSTWAAWTEEPCASRGDGALLASPSAGEVTAVCRPSAGSARETVSASHDGRAFDRISSIVAPDEVSAIASPVAGTIVGVSSTDPAELVASTTSGVDWHTVYTGAEGRIVQLGFEDADQGVAVLATAGGGQLLMTTDGGTTWAPVDLQQ